MCHGGWDVDDAIVVCRQLGFPAEGDAASLLHPINFTTTGHLERSRYQ